MIQFIKLFICIHVFIHHSSPSEPFEYLTLTFDLVEPRLEFRKC